MDFLKYLVLIGSVLIGGFIGISFPKFTKKYLNLVLAFSGAYLISVAVLHLLPEVFSGHNPKIGIAILAGFFIQLLLEQLSQGVEHGHIHKHDHSKVATTVLVGLSLHALLEGLPLDIHLHLNEHHSHEGHNHQHLWEGLILHKFPAGIALAVLLGNSSFSKKTAWLLLIGFSLMTPLGAILGANIISHEVSNWLLALVTGSLLHVSTTILFEVDEPHNHQISIAKFLVIFFGILLSILNSFFF